MNFNITSHLFFGDNDSSQYRRQAHFNVTHDRRRSFYALPSDHWYYLASPPFNYLDILSRIDDAIDVNAQLSEAILSVGLAAFGHPPEMPTSKSGDNDHSPAWLNASTSSDLNKARTTLRQFS